MSMLSSVSVINEQQAEEQIEQVQQQQQNEQSNASITTVSRLLSLPAEIRHLIYCYVLSLPDIAFARHLTMTNNICVRILPPLPIAVSLLAVNRQLNAECTPILYSRNTFTAHQTILTGLPCLLDSGRQIRSPRLIGMIKHWYLYVRLDVDPRWTVEEAKAAFSGAHSLEIEAGQAMFGAAGVQNLKRLEGVRRVGRTRVYGSIDNRFARWLETVMVLGDEDDFEDWPVVQARMVAAETGGGHTNALQQTAEAEVADTWNAWSFGNR